MGALWALTIPQRPRINYIKVRHDKAFLSTTIDYIFPRFK